MLNYEYPPLGGGAANATKYLLKEAVKAGDIEIDLVTSSVDAFEVKELSSRVRIHKLDIAKNGDLHYQSMKDLLKYSWKAYRYSKELMKKSDYTVCHAFFGIPCGFIAMMLGLPYIVSLRGSDVPFYSERFKWLDRLLFKRLSGIIWRRAKKVVANSDGLRDLAHRSHPDVQIDVIPNGVDTDLFNPGDRSQFQIGGVLKLLCVGRLISRKGFDKVICSIAELDNVELTIVGEGPEQTNLRSLSKDLGVKLKLLGRLDHAGLANVYRGHHVFVLASSAEGMSNAMLEACASGMFLLTENVGGVDELKEKNLLMNVFSGEYELKSALINLIKADFSKFKNDFESFSKHFSWRAMYLMYVKEYGFIY